MSDKDREAFEDWAKLGSDPYDVTEIGRGVYHSGNTQNAWYGWRAASAHRDAQLPGVDDLVLIISEYHTGDFNEATEIATAIHARLKAGA